MTVIDARRLRTPRNADEALAYFVRHAGAGDTIALHTDWCRLNLGDDEECTCTPRTLVLGAKA